MLYYQTGKAFQGNSGKAIEFVLNSYLLDAHGIKHGDIRKWVDDVKKLVKNPKNFKYSDWCEGKLAQYKFI